MHAVIVSSGLPLFVGALLSDWAYASSYQVQWTHFASWLIAGGLVFAGVGLPWAVADALSPRARRPRRGGVYLLLLLGTFVLGFVNALVHARDGWAAMPDGLVLSALVALLAAAACAVGLAGFGRKRA